MSYTVTATFTLFNCFNLFLQMERRNRSKNTALQQDGSTLQPTESTSRNPPPLQFSARPADFGFEGSYSTAPLQLDSGYDVSIPAYGIMTLPSVPGVPPLQNTGIATFNTALPRAYSESGVSIRSPSIVSF